ncbi:hypothetical protein IQ06DRAFT_381758 [Phaeosphaeriaceae sp. SRC1lsM3a]|nr:hypothetical protein IQ06DRAFT_381758 [Stagonospora sp. SRC1lsM3a]
MLRTKLFILCGLFASPIYTQSSGGDIPLDEQLVVTFGDAARAIYVPGTQMHPENTQYPPNISTPAWSSPSDDSPGLILMIDLDAPYEDRRVSSLHWLVTGLTISSSSPSTENPSSLNIPSSAQVPWQPPNPPIGDIAHTYAIYLIAPVPSNLDIPAELSRNRTPFDLKQWLQERDLEENVVARNYFRIRNLKGTPTAVFPGPRPSETAPLLYCVVYSLLNTDWDDSDDWVAEAVHELYDDLLEAQLSHN